MKRIVIGISGASGALYGVRALEMLHSLDIETHLVMSRAARITLVQETDYTVADVEKLADVVHQPDNIGAAISSGSFSTLGMLVAPCSIKSLSEIASGVTASLLPRAADVALKERRRVVLMVREAPLHAGHLRSMLAATEMGAIIAPPVPGFYAKPETINDIIDHSVGRALDLFGIDSGRVRRWQGFGG